MARQGKMSHSPFHVESARYRFAVEHSEEAEALPEPRDCAYYDRITRQCKLWNSGVKHCSAFVCKYYKHRLRVARVCSSCRNAIIYTDGPRCIIGKKAVSLEEASYCGFYNAAENGKAPRPGIPYPRDRIVSPKLFSSEEKRLLATKSKTSPYYGKKWCLTGQMLEIERSEMIDLIYRMKGIQENGVVGIDFVVRGNGKSTYKAKEAKKLIQNGAKMVLMSEGEFLAEIRKILEE